MLCQSIMGLLLVVAQVDRPIIPELPGPPEGVDDTTYIVTLRDGTQAIGFIQEAPNGVQLNFYEDAPWVKWPYSSQSMVSSRVDRNEETAIRRESRHNTEFPAHEYSLIDGYWIPNEIVEPAQRAHELHAQAEKQRADRYAAPETGSGIDNAGGTVPTATGPSPAQRWGAHILIAVVALVAAGVVVRFTFLQDR